MMVGSDMRDLAVILLQSFGKMSNMGWATVILGIYQNIVLVKANGRSYKWWQSNSGWKPEVFHS